MRGKGSKKKAMGMKKKTAGLTAGQKKLPPKVQSAIKKKKMKMKRK